jgi:hypothetical protein
MSVPSTATADGITAVLLPSNGGSAPPSPHSRSGSGREKTYKAFAFRVLVSARRPNVHLARCREVSQAFKVTTATNHQPPKAMSPTRMIAYPNCGLPFAPQAPCAHGFGRFCGPGLPSNCKTAKILITR